MQVLSSVTLSHVTDSMSIMPSSCMSSIGCAMHRLTHTYTHIHYALTNIFNSIASSVGVVLHHSTLARHTHTSHTPHTHYTHTPLPRSVSLPVPVVLYSLILAFDTILTSSSTNRRTPKGHTNESCHRVERQTQIATSLQQPWPHSLISLFGELRYCVQSNDIAYDTNHTLPSVIPPHLRSLVVVQAIAQSGFVVEGSSPLQRYVKAAFQVSCSFLTS